MTAVAAGWPELGLELLAFAVEASGSADMRVWLVWRAQRPLATMLLVRLHAQDLTTYTSVALRHDAHMRDASGRAAPAPDWPTNAPVVTAIRAARPPGPGRTQLVLELARQAQPYPLVWADASADLQPVPCQGDGGAHACRARTAGEPPTRLVLMRALTLQPA